MSKKREELISDINKAELIEKSPDEGLSLKDVQLRISQGLINKTPKKVTKSYWQIVVDNCFSFFNLVYFVVVVLMIIAKVQISYYFFAIPVVGNMFIGVLTDIEARRAIDKLKLITNPQATVVREGKTICVPIDDVVLHDVIIYNTGDQIVTDGEVLEGSASVDESLVTGESVKISKNAGDQVLSGTFMVSGKIYVRATMVGIANYAEGIQDEAKKFVRPKSEIKKATLKIFWITGWIAISVGLLMTLIHLIKQNGSITFEGYQDFILSLSGSLVPMIPAGLYLLTSLTLTVGVMNLAKKRMDVQQIYCIEMLARVDTICFDKTGTLTDGNLSVQDFHNFSFFSDAEIQSMVAGVAKSTGDTNHTAQALLEAYKPTSLKAMATIPFDSENKYSAATFEGKGTVAIGAYGFIDVKPQKVVEDRIKRLTHRGFRVLTVFYSKNPIEDGKIPAEFELIAVISISDRIKPDAKSNIEWFKKNGVDIKVISGDDPLTVSEIAKRVGVDNADKYISMKDVPDERIPEVANSYSVFGRVTPEQKSLLIKAIKAKGHKVAMTGDGVNDILALKTADCSIAMASGSSATRSTAHIVSVDNDFSKLPDVVAEGRRVINNLQRTASLFLSKNIFAILISVVFIFSLAFGGEPYPFTTANLILWEMVSIGFGGFFLALQPASKRIDGSFIGKVLKKAVPAGLVEVVAVLVVYFIRFIAPSLISIEDARNMSAILFTGISFLSLFLVCWPLDFYRTGVFVGALIGAAGIIYLDNFVIPFAADGTSPILHLTLSNLSSTLWWITGIMFVTSAVIYILLDIILKNFKKDKKQEKGL